MAEHGRLTFWGLIKGIGKFIVGLAVVLNAFLVLVLMILLFAVFADISNQLGDDGSGPTVKVPKGAALHLDPAGVLVEQTADVNPFDQALVFGPSRPDEVSIHDLVQVIREAKEDDRIQSMVLDLGGLYIPDIYASKMHYLADEIADFRDSGKKVIAVGDYYSQNQYFVASQADEIYMHDYGAIFMLGYGVYRNYYNDFINRLKVTNHVFRVGTYKSALEPYLRDDMSPEAKEANQAFIDALWRGYVVEVEAARGLEAGTIQNFADNAAEVISSSGGDLADAALAIGLVDELKSREEQLNYLKETIGADEDDESFKSVGFDDYLTAIGDPEDGDAPNIAVVTAAGTIVDGEQPVGVAGGDTIARALKEAREDEDVKAVVLRVDSPGGSAFASEVIRTQVLALQEEGKPVVVSMGSLAASGGYWISANADEIWAEPTTVTGSIGIFGFFQTYETAAEEFAGIRTDGVGTTDLSAVLATGIGPLPDEFSQVIQLSIEAGYDRFLKIVAEGRDMTTEAVDEIAQGRVWIGEVALENGLVDQLGGLDDAALAAATMAGVEGDYDVIRLEEHKTPFEMFIETFATMKSGFGFGDAKSSTVTQRSHGWQEMAISRMVAQAQDEVAFYESFNDPNAVYVRCLVCEPR